jgi:hypothetical protein
MNESQKRFVDRLLAADPPSPDARGRYETEVRAMLEKTLTPRERGVYLVSAVLLAAMAAFVGFGVSSPPPGPEFLKFIVAYGAVSAVALLVIAGIFFRAYWTGVVHQRTSRGWAAGVGVVYLGLLGWLFLLMAQYVPDRFQNDVRVFGLVLLVYAAVAWVRHRVTQAEMQTAEKLLEIELRLAEIGETLEARPRATDPVPPGSG